MYVRCGLGVMYGWTVRRYEILVIRLQAITTTTHSARHHTYDAREQITETGLVPDHSTLNTTTHTKTDNDKQKGGIMYDGSAEKQNRAYIR